MKTPRTLICILAKAPVRGEVKTRLARDIGTEGATMLAAAFLRDTVALARSRAWARVLVAHSGDVEKIGFLPPAVETCIQGSGDLGERMERVFHGELQRTPRVIIIGTDCPALSGEMLDAAEAALDTHDAVIGPTSDGGFYLLGLRRCPHGLLRGLPWSTSDTRGRLVARLASSRFQVADTGLSFDVDDLDGLQNAREHLAVSANLAPESQRVIAELTPGVPLDNRSARDFGQSGLRVSVVIPVLDEAARIAKRLEELRHHPVHEVIVVDGGSTDATRSIVRQFPDVRLILAAPGRARQMNEGARAAGGDVVLFLHADVALPAHAMPLVRQTLADPQAVAGAFRTWTVADDDAQAPWWRFLLHLADLRSRYSSHPYGDQAIFVRRTSFWRVGGFPDQPLMEDLELSCRLHSEGKLRILPVRVLVSGRRFLYRPIYYALMINLFPLLYHMGVSPTRLARWYGNPRAPVATSSTLHSRPGLPSSLPFPRPRRRESSTRRH
ncbi:MAG: TIGR04283 family arsenosugar biosynthesis glycosyltransferase [Planctomycetes bacterium]|nr:TIGR04283 family arsenosugar biosynthesis glycosyltransferase [Planctomycetota bacterium]